MMDTVKKIQDSKKSKKDTKLGLFFLKYPLVKYFYDFIFIIIIYGFLLNVSLRTFFYPMFNLSVMNIIGLGITFYFIQDELPGIIQRCLPVKRK